MLNQKYCNTLELNKILSLLAEETCCDDAREKALSIQPETDLTEIQRELNRVNDAFALTVRFGTPHFTRFRSPVARLKAAQAGGMLSPGDLLNIAAVLRQGQILSQWSDNFSDEDNALSEQFSRLYLNRSLERAISSAIISEEEIDDNASPELFSIRRKIRQTELKAREQLEKMTRSSTYQKYLQDNIVTMRDGRFVVPVKSEYRGQVDGLIHDTSSSGSTYFIEPIAVVEANNEIRVLKSKEQAEIERILYDLSGQVGEVAQGIQLLYQDIVDLNLLFAKSNLAAKMNARMPKVTEDGKVFLRKARHPLIDKNKVVPIDLRLGEDYTALVITGPNTGGKTVALKTLGLLTVMTMCGLLIPVADQSVISTFEDVLVDIGDEQSIEQSLSTFSAHMTNMVSILEKADFRSLVILDELGSGTDPVEGAAIAQAILEHLRKKGCRIAATTHYAELKLYALQTDGVENACCEFDLETLRPTYRLLTGVPGRSNAFAISEKLGLAPSIIDEAKNLVQSENKRFEDVIDTLETARQNYERSEREIREKEKIIEKTRLEIRAYHQKLDEEKEKELSKAKEEAARIVEKVTRDSQALMDELDALRKEKDKAEFSKKELEARSKLKSRLGKLYDTANPVKTRTNDSYTLPRPLKAGDDVRIVDIDKEGTVLKPADKSGFVTVQAGIIKTKVHQSNLRLLENRPKVQIGGQTIKRTSLAQRNVNTECDLRGKTVEEALLDLDQFIDNAVLAHLNQITIIHGKGTGALRAAVQQHLKRHKNIRTYRLGVYGEGETGVTIAELKS